MASALKKISDLSLKYLFLQRRGLVVFFCFAYLWALIYSKFVISVAMICLLVMSVFELDFRKKQPLQLNSQLRVNWQKFISNKAFLAVTVFFFLILVTGFYSSDMEYLLERLRIKLPFLLLPFAFASMPQLKEKEYLSIFYFFLILLFGSAILVGFGYWQNYEAITDGLGKGQPIPTPVNHIRYSLMMAFSIVGGIVLYFRNFYWKWIWEKWLILGIASFLFFFIHVLSVRSGILVLYASLLLLSLRFAFLRKKYLLGISSVIVLLFIPAIAYNSIEGFKQKVDYTIWDWQQYYYDLPLRSSDASRLISFKVGLEICQKEKLLGVGAGDLRKEVHQIYDEKFPDISDKKMPHNQFISVCAGMGMIGLAIFILAFFFPLFYKKIKPDALFITLHLIIFASFFTENTIENSVGVGFYVFFLLLGIHFLSQKNNDLLN
ncbi:MAG: O-antigen ligase family protein [Saprospiraceae bacterium]